MKIETKYDRGQEVFIIELIPNDSLGRGFYIHKASVEGISAYEYAIRKGTIVEYDILVITEDEEYYIRYRECEVFGSYAEALEYYEQGKYQPLNILNGHGLCDKCLKKDKVVKMYNQYRNKFLSKTLFNMT